jgi:type IV pilus assembly protein PilY1
MFLSLPAVTFASDTDAYLGDTAIYGGETAEVNPNVLIIFDTSGSMASSIAVEICTDETTDDLDLTGSFDSSIDYTEYTSDENCGTGSNLWNWDSAECEDEVVYRCLDDWTENDGVCEHWYEVTDIDEISESSCSSQITNLSTYGYYVGNVYVKSNGYCYSRSSTYYYATGEYIDWLNLTSSGDEILEGTTIETCTTSYERKVDIAKEVVSDLIGSTSGVNFGLMGFNTYEGGSFRSRRIDSVTFTSTIQDMDEIHSGTTTNREALLEIVDNIDYDDWTPLAETLYEAKTYFAGETSAFNSGTKYTSPITSLCQSNYIILITDGMSTQDRSSVLKNICDDGDCDDDDDANKWYTSNGSDYLDDVAQYLYETDLISDTGENGLAGTQNVMTFTVGFGLDGGTSDAVSLLQDTADHGQGVGEDEGASYLADDYQGLATALTSIISEVLQTDSSFTSPVVPTSPENQVYSGSRVYVGLFLPETSAKWLGNLKKYAVDSTGTVLDADGLAATDSDGAFLSTARSFWSEEADGDSVESGGVGDLLSTRALTTNPRAIYTMLDTSSALTATENAFETTNTLLTAATLGVTSTTEKNKIINYVHGYDAYDDDANGKSSETRDWILGDILHSSPAVVAYSTYSLDDEDNWLQNKSMIFVGSNDGALHAFYDYSGEEAWAFIPPELLESLSTLSNDTHEYYVDGSPSVYTYDWNSDGEIGEISNGENTQYDKVLMIVSTRRGGGTGLLTDDSRGSYTLLDITNPLEPAYVWSVSSDTTDSNGNTLLDELGETWSKPEITFMTLNGTTHLVAIFGAGYDNNEDTRFGSNQSFPSTNVEDAATDGSTADGTDVSSTGSSSGAYAKGRGVYILSLATQSSTTGELTLQTSPVVLWKYVYDAERNDSFDNPLYSFPTDIKAVDSDYDGDIDTLYAGDTGGQLWKFDVSSKLSTTNWSGEIIFKANAGQDSSDVGRKFFYPPSVVKESDYLGIYIGSGDRAHPLNKGVLDRMYAVYDRSDSSVLTEADLVDVTENILQSATATDDEISAELSALFASDTHGWFFELNEDDGEKALASAIVYNEVVYFTSFSPTVDSTDDCISGNLGISRVYAVDYATGEAVFNYDTTNENTDTENSRAFSSSGEILLESDRSQTLSSGISSSVIIMLNSDGSSSGLIGCSGGLCEQETTSGGTTFPLYWYME